MAILANIGIREKKMDNTVYWVAVKELELRYHNRYIYIYSKQ